MMYTALALVGITVAVFFIQALIPGFTDAFMLVSEDVILRPWTLVTSMFLHGDIVHLLYNMLALGLFGLILEHIIGRKRFLAIFFATGVLASIGSTFLYQASLGASGAVMGILGTLAMLRPRMQVFVMYFPMPMIVAAFVWAIGDFLGLFMPTGVANLAHLVGLGFGIGIGLYYRQWFSETRERIMPLSQDEIEEWENKYMR